MTLPAPPAPPAPPGPPRRDLLPRDRARRWLWPVAVADLVANVGIVLTGGAVRLTGSGLGCPTWPRCTPESYRPHGELGLHGVIEFGNRMLTWLLVVIALAALVVAWRAGHRRATRLAGLVALGIPAQAVIGGVTVLTDLNPWVVGLHFLVSMALVATCVVLLDALRGPARPAAPVRIRRLAVATLAAGWVVLWLGTVVTGSGPHSGDLDSRRTGLDPQTISHVHAWAVYGLLALTIAVLWAARRADATPVVRAAAALLAVEVAQGVVGFVQYFTDLPEALVAVHMLGAALLSAGLAALVLAALPSPGPDRARDPVARHPWHHAPGAGGQKGSSGSRATATKSSER